ncbi:MAG TPA: LON peptidase substrate-binding domain-containing protein [Nitrospiraceae bacterium]|nr:LON peptidase substrate-binding domain-containing protein [Nitrospiraceae bacterium]
MSLESCRRSDDDWSPFSVPNRIPVFPLPNVVFFPKTYLPLHVFEPRYREMVADTAAEGRCVGIALLKEGWEQDYYGNPPIYEVGCVGRLVSAQGLPDGRYNILLQGLHRYEIREELYSKSYRQARIALKPHAPEGLLDSVDRSELMRLVGEYLKTQDNGYVWRTFLDSDIKGEVLINTLSTYLDLTPLEKQLLLEADSLRQRARRLGDLIQFKIYEREGLKGLG